MAITDFGEADLLKKMKNEHLSTSAKLTTIALWNFSILCKLTTVEIIRVDKPSQFLD